MSQNYFQLQSQDSQNQTFINTKKIFHHKTCHIPNHHTFQSFLSYQEFSPIRYAHSSPLILNQDYLSLCYSNQFADLKFQTILNTPSDQAALNNIAQQLNNDILVQQKNQPENIQNIRQEFQQNQNNSIFGNQIHNIPLKQKHNNRLWKILYFDFAKIFTKYTNNKIRNKNSGKLLHFEQIMSYLQLKNTITQEELIQCANDYIKRVKEKLKDNSLGDNNNSLGDNKNNLGDNKNNLGDNLGDNKNNLGDNKNKQGENENRQGENENILIENENNLAENENNLVDNENKLDNNQNKKKKKRKISKKTNKKIQKKDNKQNGKEKKTRKKRYKLNEEEKQTADNYINRLEKFLKQKKYTERLKLLYIRKNSRPYNKIREHRQKLMSQNRVGQ